jgi:outer membrane protein OmpA-like peptidoglycan-associated protein
LTDGFWTKGDNKEMSNNNLSLHILLVSLGVLILIISGCAPTTTVVLLPDPDGKVGALTVSTEAGSVDIAKAGEATTVKSKKSLPSTPAIMPEEKIAATFGEVLASLPEPPVHFILYFQSGSTSLTNESAGLLPKILETVNERESQSISVVGHTDTAGNRQYNFRLSTQRANAVSRLLIEKGVKKGYLKVTSHGEENPLVKTADNVNEPRNRRVEVIVR